MLVACQQQYSSGDQGFLLYNGEEVTIEESEGLESFILWFNNSYPSASFSPVQLFARNLCATIDFLECSEVTVDDSSQFYLRHLSSYFILLTEMSPFSLSATF